MSPLQQQYPLSPRKFWKKMISGVLGWTIVLALAGPIPVFLYFTSFDSTLTASQADSQRTVVGYVALAIPALWLVLAVVQAWYYKVYIRRYYYDAGDSFVTIKKGVFAPAEIHVMYQKIQDVYVDQDILDRVMGLYDVHLASATVTSGMEAHIDGVEHDAAEGLKQLLLARIQGGGGGAPVANTQGMPAMPQTPAAVQLSEQVSSSTYPLSNAWLTQSLIGYFLSAVLWAFLIAVYVFSKSNGELGALSGGLPIFILSFLIIFVFHVVYLLIWKSVYYFEFLPEYILMRTGVISRSEVHVPYRAVQDVLVSQGVVERMFGLATVNIQNAAQAQMQGRKLVRSGVQIPGQPLARANHIAEVVRSVTLTKNSAQTGL